MSGSTPGVSIGANFSGSDSYFAAIQPPDSDGAIGPGYFVELVNGSYSVYTLSGQVVQRSSQHNFWTSAGLTPDGDGYDPRILYDPQSGRWFAAAITPTHFLLAVSDTSDPTQGWHAVSVLAATGSPKFLDYTALGVNEQGVYLEASNDWYVVAIPKEDLLQKTPSAGNAVLFTSNQDPVTPGLPGFVAQPAVAPFLAGSEPFISAANWDTGEIRISSIDWSGTVPSLNASGRSLTVGPMQFPVPAPQLGTDVPIESQFSGLRFGSSAVYQDGKLFVVQTQSDAGHDVLHWYEIGSPLAAPTLVASGEIGPPGLDIYYGSIAVNPLGEVVIGFSGSSSQQYAGSYAVAGTLTPTGLQLGDPMLLAAGSAAYLGGRWGDYSTTTFDPANPAHFWTIQELPISETAWQTQITEITFGAAVANERRWVGGKGNFSDPAKWSPPGAPDTADTLVIAVGKVRADGLTISNPLIKLGSSTSVPTLLLKNTSLADTSAVRVQTDSPDPSATVVRGRITAEGLATVNGTIYVGNGDSGSSQAHHAYLTVGVARNAIFTLGPTGKWYVGEGSILGVKGRGPGARLVNNGTVDNLGGTVRMDVMVSGQGTFDIASQTGNSGHPGTLEFVKEVGRAQTVRIDAGVLRLDEPMRFLGTIEDFNALSSVDLVDTQATSADYHDNLLRIFCGHRLVAALDLVGSFTSDQFRLNHVGGDTFVTVATTRDHAAPSAVLAMSTTGNPAAPMRWEPLGIPGT